MLFDDLAVIRHSQVTNDDPRMVTVAGTPAAGTALAEHLPVSK